jgi:3-oxoadipate enol-lactonase
MPTVQVGEIELDYERGGSGPPLLMIMGRSGTYAHWEPTFLADLQRDFETIVYDHRGVGASSRLQEGTGLTIRQMAQDASGLLSALAIDSAHVLGISMGGMIAQELALAEPERIRTLALGCTYCGGPGSAHTSPAVVERVLAAVQSGDRERVIRASWEANVSPTFAADEDAWQRFRAIGMSRRVALPVIAAQTQACIQHDTSTRLGEIALPTLVIHGTVDEILPVVNGHMIAELIPHAHFELFEDVGHLFFWERSERFAELLRAHAATHA